MNFFVLQFALLLISNLIVEINCVPRKFFIFIKPIIETPQLRRPQYYDYIYQENDNSSYGIHLLCFNNEGNIVHFDSELDNAESNEDFIDVMDANIPIEFKLPEECNGTRHVRFYMSKTTNSSGSSSSGRSRNGNGHSGSGHSGNGHSGNGHSGSGHSGNGHSGNGHSGSGHSGNGHSGSGHPQHGGFEFVHGPDYNTWPNGEFHVRDDLDESTINVKYYFLLDNTHQVIYNHEEDYSSPGSSD